MADAAHRSRHIVLTSFPGKIHAQALPIHWGAKTPQERGPVVASVHNRVRRNAIGTHGGSYSVYRALAMAAGSLKEDHKPDLKDTEPVIDIGPFPSWSDPKRIVSIDLLS